MYNLSAMLCAELNVWTATMTNRIDWPCTRELPAVSWPPRRLNPLTYLSLCCVQTIQAGLCFGFWRSCHVIKWLQVMAHAGHVTSDWVKPLLVHTGTMHMLSDFANLYRFFSSRSTWASASGCACALCIIHASITHAVYRASNVFTYHTIDVLSWV